MIIKLSGKEIKEVRKELIEDMSKQEIRSILDKQVDKYIKDKVEKLLNNTSMLDIHRKITNAIQRTVDKEFVKVLRTDTIKLTKLTVEKVIENLDLKAIEDMAKVEVRKQLIEKLR